VNEIIKKILPENDLTIFTVIGKVAAHEIVAAIHDFYENDITSNILWDLNKSDLSESISADVERIAALSVEYAGKRPTGKTAIVGSDDFTFGISRMYEITKESAQLPFKTQAFRDIQDAYEWLLSD
jgi:hypothetical protein